MHLYCSVVQRMAASSASASHEATLQCLRVLRTSIAKEHPSKHQLLCVYQAVATILAELADKPGVDDDSAPREALLKGLIAFVRRALVSTDSWPLTPASWFEDAETWLAGQLPPARTKGTDVWSNQSVASCWDEAAIGSGLCAMLLVAASQGPSYSCIPAVQAVPIGLLVPACLGFLHHELTRVDGRIAAVPVTADISVSGPISKYLRDYSVAAGCKVPARLATCLRVLHRLNTVSRATTTPLTTIEALSAVTAARFSRELALRHARWASKLLDGKPSTASQASHACDPAATHEVCRAVCAAADAMCSGLSVSSRALAKAVDAAGKVMGSLGDADSEALSDIIAELKRPGTEGLRRWSDCGRAGALSGRAAALLASSLVAQSSFGRTDARTVAPLSASSSAPEAAMAASDAGTGPLFTIDRVGVATKAATAASL